MFNPNLTFQSVKTLKSTPRVLLYESKLTKEKLFNLPQVINKLWTLWPYIGAKTKKWIPSNLGGQFATLGANDLLEVKFKFMQNISHYCNNIFAFHMPMFIISILSLNKLNITIHSNIIFMVIAYNQNLHFRIHCKKLHK